MSELLKNVGIFVGMVLLFIAGFILFPLAEIWALNVLGASIEYGFVEWLAIVILNTAAGTSASASSSE